MKSVIQFMIWIDFYAIDSTGNWLCAIHDINLFGLMYGTVQFKQCIILIIVLMHITTVRVNWQRHTTHNSYNCLCVHTMKTDTG